MKRLDAADSTLDEGKGVDLGKIMLKSNRKKRVFHLRCFFHLPSRPHRFCSNSELYSHCMCIASREASANVQDGRFVEIMSCNRIACVSHREKRPPMFNKFQWKRMPRRKANGELQSVDNL